MTVVPPTAQVPRDRWGRPKVQPPGGGNLVPYRRCTTFIAVLEDRYNLEKWKQRQVAHGMAIRPDLVLKAASANGDKTLLDEVCEVASEAAGSSTASTTGSAVHKLTEHIDRGEDVVVPPTAQADIDAYRQATRHLTVREVEVFVVHDDLQVGGTFDRIVEVDGVRYIADIKTGRIDYGASEIAMQLAVYSRSRRYYPSSGRREPLDVDTSRGLVIHLPAGGGDCSLHWADLDSGWGGVEIARQVWRWRSVKGLLDAGPPSRPLVDLIAEAPDRATLELLWQVHQHEWTDIHTVAARRRIQALEASPVTAGATTS